MTDLKNGVIEIDGFEFKPDTTLDDVKNYFDDKISILQFVPNETTIKFKNTQYLDENFYIKYVDFGEKNTIKHTTIVPIISKEIVDTVEMAKEKLAISKWWLNKTISEKSIMSNDTCVYYKFDDVDYYSSLVEDRDYGMRGGEIEVSFHKG